jgi:dCTP diphosphatase
MSKRDDETTIQELKELVIQFGRERHWERHHTPKNLSMNIAIEAAELMELFVWDRSGAPDPEDVSDELADVLFNVLNFAQSQDIDITSAFMKKLERTKEKYPTDKFNETKDDLDEYKRIKKDYRSRKGNA